MPHAREVVIGVVAYLMATPTDFLKQVRIFEGILAYHKEGGFGIETV